LEDVKKSLVYTGRQNLVAVISNGTAVLGLGNIGPYASKPVMEGKAVLFKTFGDVNAFDLEVDENDPDKFIDIVASLEPTFGGINLEDIKAPECFYIEEQLQQRMNIPVFHDDQHGTAIVTLAGLLNACEIQGKSLDTVKIVFSGAGSSAIATAKILMSAGVPSSNILMCDTLGVIYKGRTERMNPYKEQFAADTDCRTLEEAMLDSDVFIGMSIQDIVTKKMLQSMSAKPIVFALANPDPEISYEAAKDARDDLILATGRSDYPNQVNNVLGFPFIFKGALAVHATKINTEMKAAASKALAELAKEPVPAEVCTSYGVSEMSFGKDYIIPKPLDMRVGFKVSLAVAQAAIDSGVGVPTEAYRRILEAAKITD
jgi:malate dehydrogenase (oxaloacetate-decarboxylating)(NADP+)